MAFANVQTKTAVSTSSGTAVACTFTTPPTEGNLLVAVVAHNGTSVLGASNWDVTALTSGNAYWYDFEACTVYHFAKVAEPSATSAFSVTAGASVAWAVCLREYSADGVPTAESIDFENFTANASSYVIGTLNIHGANDLVLASFAHQGTLQTASSWSGGFSQYCEITGAGTVPVRMTLADQFLTTTGLNPSTMVTLSGTTTQIPAMMFEGITTTMDPTRSRPIQQNAPAGW